MFPTSDGEIRLSFRENEVGEKLPPPGRDFCPYLLPIRIPNKLDIVKKKEGPVRERDSHVTGDTRNIRFRCTSTLLTANSLQ